MKRSFVLYLVCVLIGCSQIDELTDRVTNLEDRVNKIEALCSDLNTNISAIQSIIVALQSNDYILSVKEILEGDQQIGYKITFNKSGEIIIYHGRDGKDGESGKDGNNGTDGKDGEPGQDGTDGADGKDGLDGQDGITPIIGVALYNGYYYWTLNGEWLLDDNGEMICASGQNGKNGEDGSDGKDGADGVDGKDGQDGITPQLKIENGYWYISYDNGVTWSELGKAVGANGSDGADGEDGDSFFSYVDTSDPSYVIFTLADGNVIKVPTWAAFEELQKLCIQMNTNISSIQTIVTALHNNDYITSIDAIFEDDVEIGYRLNFAKSQSLTIYHGKDGANGKDGAPGKTPNIGISLGYGGLYYWTLNGSFLLDENGNEICVSGKDGEDGKDGENGTDGRDGQDGITPLLKIENDYWHISYDYGVTWSELGVAVGANGSDGADGEDGDSFFQDVYWDSENLYMTLSNGESIILPIAEKKLEIIIDKDLPIIISAGQTINLSCNVTIDSEPVDSEVCVSYNGNIKAKYTSDPQIPGCGIVTITATEEVDEYSNVIIMASDGVRAALKCLSFENGVLNIVGDNEISFPAEGGEISIKYLTNIASTDYSIYISSVSVADFAPTTKSITEHSETLRVYPNEYDGHRECEIEIVESRENGLKIKWKIKQAPSKKYLEVADNLMVLYDSLGGENWTDNTNWGTDEPWESWYGIMENTVEISSGYYVPDGVWSIGLDNNNLCGQIPENIAELFPNLNSLTLRGNSKLSGALPESIGSCTKLYMLDCGMCGLSGTIPSTLGDCSNLEYLSLDYNQFSGKIPAEIAKCNNLKGFNVEHNQLEGSIPQEFCHYLTLNARFGYNKFSSLPENIDQFKWMEYLSFAHNSISSIPEAVYSMNWLKVIDLSHNALEMEFPAKLCNMSNLTGIDLSSNKIYGNIPEEIGNLTSLCSLIMSQTYLSGQIPNRLYNLHNLERLDLSHSDFGADGNAFDSAYLSNYQGLSGNISSQIGNLAKLTYLDLSCNSISGEIPEELCLCSNLEQVHLGDNYITGDIPENIGVLKKLDYIDLSFNKMSGEIPNSMFFLANLRKLILQGGESVINPDALGRMRTEQNNRFTGELSSDVANLINLQQFYLTETYMTGSLPDEMFQMLNLTDVLLFNNRFSGTLPSSVRSAKWWKDESILLQQDGYGLSVSEN